MLRERRHHLILEALRAQGTLAVGAIAGLVGASEATIRRDLRDLDAAGLLRRVHGGALAVDEHDEPFDAVRGVNAQAKAAIAQVAASLVADGETVLLDIGTTTHRIAMALRGRPLTIVTASLPIAQVVAGDPTTELLVLGGLVRREYHSMVGHLTELALSQVHADRLFLSTSGIRPDGSIMDTTALEVPVKRLLLRAASTAHVVADAAKFPGRGASRVCGAAELTGLVTEPGADPGTLTALRAAGVEVRTTAGVATRETASDIAFDTAAGTAFETAPPDVHF